MSIKLSKRMKSIADMVTPGRTVADIGCDHGYVSIYLVEEGIADKVYAMDVAEGPLGNARESISERGLSDKIEARLSNGFEAIEAGQTDCAVISGMGGFLIMDIITDGLHKIEPGYELVLSPQSDVPLVRTFLREHGFEITDEDMLSEDGKYYNIIKAKKIKGEISGETDSGSIDAKQLMLYDTYGRRLIEKKHPVLRGYLEKKAEKYQGLFCRISKQSGDKSVDRLSQLRTEIEDIEKVLALLGESGR